VDAIDAVGRPPWEGRAGHPVLDRVAMGKQQS